jgi:Na+/proline symporter
MLFLTNHLWLCSFFLVGVTTLIAMAGPIIIRRQVSFEKLSNNNEVAGFKFAVVGVLYAVMLAFAVIVVWEKFNDAEKDVAQEAGAATMIYRLSEGIPAAPGGAIRGALVAYLNAAIADDWPAMERGTTSPLVTRALHNLYTAVLSFNSGANRDTALLSEILYQLDQITQARRARDVMASGNVPAIVWLGLFGGAAVTLGFTFFFGSENLRAQSMMTGALSILIFSSLLIVIAIDYPFAGKVKVEPHALSVVLEDFRSDLAADH